jgi:hypothetical protein
MVPGKAARLLVKVGCGQGKALGSEGGKAMGLGLLEYAADRKKWAVAEFGMNFIY